MKFLLFSLVAGIGIVFPARADEQGEKRFLEVMAVPSATKEQREKLLFAARIAENYSPKFIVYDLQNGLSDSVVAGIFVDITYKDPESGNEKTIEVYADCQDLLPFSVTNGQIRFFQADAIAKLNPKITLRDVRVRKLKD